MRTLMLTLAAIAVAGCSRTGRPGGSEAAYPVPDATDVAHGYETDGGRVVRYSDVETGGGEDGYSDRATAR